MISCARIAVLFMALLAIGASQCAHAQVVAGLWQMHERDLWFQVNVDGSTLRCWVVGEDGAVVVHGVLQSAKAIKWKSALGTEEVEFRRDSLTAKSTYGLLTFVPAEDVMPASCRAQSQSNESNGAVGLWRIPGHWTWIQMNSDGSALQCRTFPNKALGRVKGVLNTPRTIKWANDVGTDVFETRAGSLLVKSSFGNETFEPAEVPMPPSCTSRAGG